MTIVNNNFIFINTNTSCDHGSLVERKNLLTPLNLMTYKAQTSKHDIAYW